MILAMLIMIAMILGFCVGAVIVEFVVEYREMSKHRELPVSAYSGAGFFIQGKEID